MLATHSDVFILYYRMNYKVMLRMHHAKHHVTEIIFFNKKPFQLNKFRLIFPQKYHSQKLSWFFCLNEKKLLLQITIYLTYFCDLARPLKYLALFITILISKVFKNICAYCHRHTRNWVFFYFIVKLWRLPESYNNWHNSLKTVFLCFHRNCCLFLFCFFRSSFKSLI